MNKRFDFTQAGGFPFTQEVLDFMQQSYRDAMKGVAGLCGNKTILSGVVVSGGSVSNGWISYNDELIPFIGGATGAGVVVEETSESLLFEDGVNRPVKFTKVAYIGTPQTFPFSDLKKLTALTDIWLPGDVKQVDCNNAYIVANFDSSGLGINERAGWAICNGANGTVDRRGRFPVGWDNRDTDPGNGWWDVVYNLMGATGGEKQHTLTIAEMPSHNHTITASTEASFGGSGRVPGVNAGGTESGGTTDNRGSGTPHENRPPFIVSLFIQKL